MPLPERNAIQQLKVVSVIADDAAGTIIDAQTLNSSDPGTNAGGQLGSAIGSAAYVDNAFKGNDWNYSAKTHLGASLVGAFLGSALDRPPTAAFTTRYAVRTLDGQVKTITQTKDNAFRQSIGVCVTLPDLELTDQSVCGTPAAAPIAVPAMAASQPDTVRPQTVVTSQDDVLCKFGVTAPIRTTEDKCNANEGKIIR
jgi:outer membrane lipoprotein SlyB